MLNGAQILWVLSLLIALGRFSGHLYCFPGDRLEQPVTSLNSTAWMGCVSRYQEVSCIFEVQCSETSKISYFSVTSGLEVALRYGRKLLLECREIALSPPIPLPESLWLTLAFLFCFGWRNLPKAYLSGTWVEVRHTVVANPGALQQKSGAVLALLCWVALGNNFTSQLKKREWKQIPPKVITREGEVCDIICCIYCASIIYQVCSYQSKRNGRTYRHGCLLPLSVNFI